MATREYPSNTFDGMLDEVGIWGKALNSTEIVELYNGGLGINPQTNQTPPTPPAQAPVIFSQFPTSNPQTVRTQNITFAWRIDKKNRDIVNSSVYITNLSNYTVRYTRTNFTYVNISNGTTGNTNYTFVYADYIFPVGNRNYTYHFTATNTAGNVTMFGFLALPTRTINASFDVPSPPIVSLLEPLDLSVLNYSVITFHYNASGINMSNSTLWLYNSTGLINSFLNSYTEPSVYLNQTLTDENYTWFVEASNLANNITLSNNFTFQVFTPFVSPPSPVFPPIIILKSPLDTAQLNYTSITFNYNISDTNVTNSTLYLYDGLGFVNSYLNLYTEAEIYINETLPNQNYSWFVIGSNSGNNISISGNSTFQIYTTAIITPLPDQTTGGIIYEVLATSGAGIGIFFQILANALPLLLFGLAIVGIIVIIGHSIIKPLIKAGKL
jgi:hypothetical protein